MSSSAPDLPSDPDELRALVEDLVRRQTNEVQFSSTVEYRDLLRARYDQYSRRVLFEPGQLVKWKEGLANKTRPASDSVGIVVQHLAEPLPVEWVERRDSSSPYFNEPLDLALGVITSEDRRFAIYWFDSQRFERAE